jgi:hypothetical protein
MEEKPTPNWMTLFLEFDQKNPHVYDRFKELTMDRITHGHKTYGARLVYGRLRWDYDIPTERTAAAYAPFDGYPNAIRLNDSHVGFYARMFMHEEPQHEGFFKRRKTFIYEKQFQKWLEDNFEPAPNRR